MIVEFSYAESHPAYWARSEASEDTWNSWNGFLHGQIFIQRPHDPRIPLFIPFVYLSPGLRTAWHKTFRGTFIFDRDDRDDDSIASWRKISIRIECQVRRGESRGGNFYCDDYIERNIISMLSLKCYGQIGNWKFIGTSRKKHKF